MFIGFDLATNNMVSMFVAIGDEGNPYPTKSSLYSKSLYLS